MAQSSDNDVANKVLMPTTVMVMMMMMMMMTTAMLYHSIIIILYYCCYKYLSLLFFFVIVTIHYHYHHVHHFYDFHWEKKQTPRTLPGTTWPPFRDTTSKRAKAARNIWSCLGGLDRYWGCTLPKFHMEPEKLPSWATNISPDIPWKSPILKMIFSKLPLVGYVLNFLKSYRGPIGKDRLPFASFFRCKLLNFRGCNP